jgi:Rod binding domain-containing protein
MNISIDHSRPISALDTQADTLLQRTRSGAAPASAHGVDQDAKIEKAGKDFESILLGNWLQQAENSFATVPGGDGVDDSDPGKDQFQGLAMQALAGSLTKSGGIGIAKMITQHLRSADAAASAKAEKQPNPTP